MKEAHEFCLAIAATFTAEPLEQSLLFWLKELEISSYLEFTPYNQIFQELLDPSSLFSNNKQGINLVLVRLEDWQGSQEEEVYRNIKDFSQLIEKSLTQHKTPYIVVICPSSPAQQSLLEKAEKELSEKLASLAGLNLVTKQDLETYPVENYYDQTRDELGHIPFTPLFFTALGTVIARKIYSLKNTPHKVIVLDCDNTIWQGVVGEDGVEGIKITPQYREIQKFMLQQKEAGMLLSLCSKNTEADVLEVFQKREDLELKLEDLVNWKVNWQPKSENLKALARELNLGLDSFIFIDDNPVECAEVRNNAPEVLTINLPIEKEPGQFLKHIWAFDHLKVTEEDQQRTVLYQQNIQRERFQQETTTLEDFLSGLSLEIEITEPSPEQLTRVAQLTQRTNQFNFTTKRYIETEIAELLAGSLKCQIVQVKDRFGDYGLVGVMLFSLEVDSLKIDNLLLSCRVLGRGVEHKMLQTLGKIAQEANLSLVIAPYIKTKKNLPALNFLEKVGQAYQKETEGGFDFVFPTEFAANLSYVPTNESSNLSSEVVTTKAQTATGEQKTNKNELINHIAKELYQVELIENQLKQQQEYSQRTVTTPYVPPITFIERQLAKIWTKVLATETIGIDDDYFELGGTSLQSVELFAEIEKEFSTRLPLTTLIQAPTIKQIAQLLNQTGQLTTNSSLVLLNEGEAYPPLFLVHDGFGETLLYRNLARKLQPQRPVYGLQPLSQAGYPILHTRIKDMAAFYLEQVRNIQPDGPYLLGGMCAGGVIALEMALQLQEQGQKISALALMDSANIGIAKKIESTSTARLNRVSSVLSETGDLSVKDRLLTVINTLSKKVSNVIAYELSILNKKIKSQLFDYCVTHKIPLSPLLKGLNVMNVYNYAETKHVFTSKYQGDILLLRATKGEGTDRPFAEIYSDPLLGWAENTTGNVTVLDVPGGHSSMLQDPNVAIMAKYLQDYINIDS